MKEFCVNGHKREGNLTRSSHCRTCNHASQRKYYKNTLPKQKDYARKWRLLTKYELTQYKYEELAQNQEFKCAICGVHQRELGRVLAVDHDHKTNKIRGLLCDCCNLGIGCFKEKKSNFQSAQEYLEKYGA